MGYIFLSLIMSWSPRRSASCLLLGSFLLKIYSYVMDKCSLIYFKEMKGTWSHKWITKGNMYSDILEIKYGLEVGAPLGIGLHRMQQPALIGGTPVGHHAFCVDGAIASPCIMPTRLVFCLSRKHCSLTSKYVSTKKIFAFHKLTLKCLLPFLCVVSHLHNTMKSFTPLFKAVMILNSICHWWSWKPVKAKPARAVTEQSRWPQRLPAIFLLPAVVIATASDSPVRTRTCLAVIGKMNGPRVGCTT